MTRTLYRPFPASAFLKTMARPRTSRIPLDIVEQEDRFLVAADIPGVRVEELALHVHEGVLTIETSQTGSGRRSLALPSTVDTDGIEAEVSNGVARIRLPKKKEAQPRRIEIKNS